MPQVGQVAAAVLPIPALTLFGWRVLGNRWLGLVAAAIVGLLSVVPAYYIEWSRYPQGLGLAVLPVAWVLFAEAVRADTRNAKRDTRVSWPVAGRRLSVIVLAALAAAGLFLTHYRITVIYAGFAILYILWITFTETSTERAPTLAFRASRFVSYASLALLVALLSLILILPWLLNFLTNFRTVTTGREDLDTDAYYATAERLGSSVIGHLSLPILAALAAIGMVILGRRLWRHSFVGLALGALVGLLAFGFSLYIWLSGDLQRLELDLKTTFLGLSPVTWFLVIEIVALSALLVGGALRAPSNALAREAIIALPALTWLVLALWSSPGLLPFRLPYAGYLDAVTLASSAWLPVCLLASYALVNSWQRVARLVLGTREPADAHGTTTRGLHPVVLPLTIAALAVIGLASSMTLAPIKERRPYIESADMDALLWMRDNLPADSYVLANSFNFPWSPTQPLGLDSGLWVPLVAGLRSSVPPINAYNEKPADDQYFNRVLALAAVRSLPTTEAEWQTLQEQGVTHIYIGSRAAGAGFSAPDLLQDPHVDLLFHRDAVWLFGIRDRGSGAGDQSGSQVAISDP